MPPALLFDLDDTLIRCSAYYSEARERFQALLASVVPEAPEEEVGAELTRQGRKWSGMPAGYDRDRFPTNMVDTYRLIAERYGRTPSPETAQRIYELGSEVFRADFSPYPGVRDTLTAYRSAGFQLGLITKGDVGVQRRKLERADLTSFFEAVRYVDRAKKPDDFRSLVHELGGHPSTMIGDSLRDDIAQAQAAGLETVLVDQDILDDNPFLADFNDGVRARPDHVISHVTELPSVLPLERSRRRLARR